MIIFTCIDIHINIYFVNFNVLTNSLNNPNGQCNLKYSYTSRGNNQDIVSKSLVLGN